MAADVNRVVLILVKSTANKQYAFMIVTGGCRSIVNFSFMVCQEMGATP